MDYLKQLFLGLLGGEAKTFVLLLVVLSVFFFVLAIFYIFSVLLDPVRMRYEREIKEGIITKLPKGKLTKRLQSFARFFMPADQALLSRTAQRLQYAGYYAKNSLLFFYALRIMLMISLPLILIIIISVVLPLSKVTSLYVLLMSCAIGYVIPSFTLDKQISTRQKLLRRAFPDALDLLVVCTEAGLSLEGAIQRVAAEMRASNIELAQELKLVLDEIKVGIDKNKALKNLAERTGVEDIKGLVAALSQSIRFGTGIAETLRIYSEDFRDKRTQAAEETASKISVKLIFPLAFCFFPGFLVTILAPILIALFAGFASIK